MNQTIIIPAYNPPESFIQLLTKIQKITTIPIIIVDDGSNPMIKLNIDYNIILRNKRNRGK